MASVGLSHFLIVQTTISLIQFSFVFNVLFEATTCLEEFALKKYSKNVSYSIYICALIYFYVDLTCGTEYRQEAEKATRVGRQFSTSFDLANEKSNFQTTFEEIAKEF